MNQRDARRSRDARPTNHGGSLSGRHLRGSRKKCVGGNLSEGNRVCEQTKRKTHQSGIKACTTQRRPGPPRGRQGRWFEASLIRPCACCKNFPEAGSSTRVIHSWIKIAPCHCEPHVPLGVGIMLVGAEACPLTAPLNSGAGNPAVKKHRDRTRASDATLENRPTEYRSIFL